MNFLKKNSLTYCHVKDQPFYFVGRSVGQFVRWFVYSFLWNPLPSHDNIRTLGLYDNTATNTDLAKLSDHTCVNRRCKQSKSNMITFAALAPLSAKSMWHLQQCPEWRGLLGPAQGETPRFRQCSTSHHINMVFRVSQVRHFTPQKDVTTNPH